MVQPLVREWKLTIETTSVETTGWWTCRRSQLGFTGNCTEGKEVLSWVCDRVERLAHLEAPHSHNHQPPIAFSGLPLTLGLLSVQHGDPVSQSTKIGLFSIVGFPLSQPPSQVSNMKIHYRSNIVWDVYQNVVEKSNRGFQWSWSRQSAVEQKQRLHT